MKRIILLLLSALPIMVLAQSNCDFFEKVIIEIEKTEINTTASDFGPSIVNDGFWFSAFTQKEIDKIARGSMKDVFYNTYSMGINKSGNISGEKQIQLEEISSDYHAGPVSYCDKTGELFVTLSNYENPDVKNKVFRKADIRLKIIIAKQIDGEWKLVEELPFNNKEYSVGHPSVSVTGDTLLFASDMPDKGFGESDIYLTVRKNGKWGELVNLGENINTSGDDMFPFFFRGNSLIYSSKGIEETADLDLYTSCLIGNSFSKGVALEEFNTEEDDFGLVIHKNEDFGFFSSRRAGGLGDDDIYKVIFNEKAFVKGKVIDDATEVAIVGASIVLMDCGGKQLASTTSGSGGEFSFAVERADCLKAVASKSPYHDEEGTVKDDYVLLRMKGDYKLELLVRDKKSMDPVANTPVKFSDKSGMQNTSADGMIRRDLDRNKDYVVSSELSDDYMNESAEFTTVKHPYGTIKVILNVEKVKVGQTFTLENIYYDFDKWDILSQSEVELDKLVKILNDNPGWKVELGSHTDCRGRDSYNEWLSQKRSDSAVGYIISKGIKDTRIVAKGYGETQLVNKCDDGVQCSEAEHRKNRRTEFKILGMDEN